MEYFFIWIIGSFIVAGIGSDREIGGFPAFLISIFLSPLLGAIIVLASSKKSTVQFQRKLLEEQKKQTALANSAKSDLQILDEKFQSGLITQEEYVNILKKMAQS